MKHEGEEVLGAAAPLEPLLCLICFCLLFFILIKFRKLQPLLSEWKKACVREAWREQRQQADCCGVSLNLRIDCVHYLSPSVVSGFCLTFFLFFQWQPLSLQAGSGPADPGSVRKSRFHGWAASLCFTLSRVDLRKPLTRCVCPVVSHRGGDQQHEERAGEVRHPDARLQQDRRHPGQWAVCGRGCTWEMALMMSQGEGPGVWSLTNFNRFITLGRLSLYKIHDKHDGLRELKLVQQVHGHWRV